MQQQKPAILSEEDLASTVLSDLKRVVREYATAATESTCPKTRQMFTDMLNSTLSLQGQLFETMSQNNMYAAASPALKQELTKQATSYTQTQQGTNQWIGQQLGAQAGFGGINQQSAQMQHQYM